MASWCLPASSFASAEAGAPDAHADMHQRGVRSDSPESERSHPEAPPCAFGGSGAGASCGAAPLPASTEASRAAPIEQSTLLPPGETADLILVTAHFRPPRA
jgi:hypothetical protein